MYPAPGTGYGGGFGGNAPAGVGGGHNREVRYKVVVTADTSHAQQQLANLTASAHQAGNAARLAAPYGVHPAVDRPAYQPGYSAAQYGAAYTQLYSRPLPGYASAYAPAAAPAGGGAAQQSTGSLAVAALTAHLSGFQTVLAGATASIVAMTQANNAATLSLRNTVSARAKMDASIGAVPLVGGLVNQLVSPVYDYHEQYGLQPGSYWRQGLESGLARQKYEAARQGRGWWARQFEGTMFDLDRHNAPRQAARELAARDADYVFNSPFVTQQQSTKQQGLYALDDAAVSHSQLLRQAATRRALGVRQAGLLFAPAPDAVGPDPRRVLFDARPEYDALIRQAERDRVGAQGGLVNAGYEYLAASQQRQESADRLPGLRQESDAAFAKARQWEAQAQRDPTVHSRLQRATAEATEKQAAYQAEAVRYQEMLNREKRAGLALAEREYELSQRTLDVDRARLDVLERKRDKVRGYAEQFGTYDPVRQQGVLNVAERADRVGFQGLTPEEKELLLATGATQEFARERSRQAAFDSPAFRQVLRQVGQQDQEVLDAEIAQVKRKVEVEYELNEKKFEEQMNEVLKRMQPQVVDAIAKVVGIQLKAIELRRVGAMAAANR